MENQHDIEKKVMSEIVSGKVKLRSKYIFLAEKLGLRSAIILSVLLAILFFNLALFYLKESDNLGYLSFGSRGLFAFLESFPYVLVISFIIIIFVAGYMIKKSGTVYKRPFGYVALGLIGFVIFGGMILAFTDVADRIEQRTFGPGPGFFFRPFLGPGLDERQRGIVGRVIEIGDRYIVIQTPRDTQRVDVASLEVPFQGYLAPGTFVIAIGERKGDLFEARDIRVIDDQEQRIIRRGVNRHFGPFDVQPPGRLFMN